MTENKNLSKLRLALLTTAVATGIAAPMASAEDAEVSQKDMLKQAVALYEKMADEEVAVPDALVKQEGDRELAKAVMLGFTSADDLTDSVTIRKQDAMTVLYKTIIGYDYSFALDSDEIDEIMSTCYDNALVDEENRAGYAFMLKHGIIDSAFGTEPNKTITWSGCRTLVDVLYDLFVHDVTFQMGDDKITIGSNIETVTEVFGEPTRIDKSDCDFDWYTYNSDPTKFMMVGVKEDRICAFFSNAQDLVLDNTAIGDDYLFTYKYADDPDFRFIRTPDERIDAILYNPYTKSDVTLKNDAYLRSCRLVDMINANRVKNGKSTLDVNTELYNEAKEMAPQPKYHELALDNRFAHTMDGAQHEAGYDIFAIYQSMVTGETEALGDGIKSIGLATYADDDFNIYASILCGKEETAITTEGADITAVSPDTQVVQTEPPAVPTPEEVFAPMEEETPTEETPSEDSADEVSELKMPRIISPTSDVAVTAGDDVTIELEPDGAKEYYVEVYSIEDDEYLATSYMTAVDNKLTLTADMFTPGKDYTLSLMAVTDSDMSEKTSVTFSYGTVPDGAVVLDGFGDTYATDDDYIDLKWHSDLYTNFVVDIYTADGKLVLSENVTNINELTINNIDPGTYYLYVTALRQGTDDVFKAQAMTTLEITLPQPVITEHILEDGEKFYPVYEDDEMGLLYFYSEDIIDVPTENGTVKRKRIIEKQVKSVAYYRNLAASRERVEYFTGSTVLDTQPVSDTYNYSGSTISIYNETVGTSAVREAEKYLGVPYLWGGTTPKGFDCSGLVQYVYKSLGIEIPRVSQSQYLTGAHISREDLMPGDLVFFQKNGDVHHVGMYVGNGMMIHAPYTGAYVSYQSIDVGQYKEEFCGGRRVY